MPKDDGVFVGHMLDLARSAVAKASSINRAQFDSDENLRLALVHLIQTLGEAARRVSQPYRDAHANVPWAAIIGMRNKVVHDYLYVDFDIVWDVAKVDLPALVSMLEQFVDS